MHQHTLYGKTPTCPNCGKKQDGALGGKNAPRDNSVCVCAYCACINIFEVTGNIYKLHIATEEELEAIRQEGLLERIYALQDFVKLKIKERSR